MLAGLAFPELSWDTVVRCEVMHTSLGYSVDMGRHNFVASILEGGHCIQD